MINSVAQWATVAVLLALFFLALEARFSLGLRIARIERDMAWLIAGLKKWGLAAPGYDVDSGMVAKLEHDQRPPKPPTPRG